MKVQLVNLSGHFKQLLHNGDHSERYEKSVASRPSLTITSTTQLLITYMWFCSLPFGIVPLMAKMKEAFKATLTS